MQKIAENYSELVLNCSKIKENIKIENYGPLKLKRLCNESFSKIAVIENYGVIKVPKGFRERVLELVKENYGAIEEYEEDDGNDGS